MTTRALAFAFALFALVFARVAAAAPQLRTTVFPRTVEVGDTATVQLTVAPGDQVTQAELRGVPAGIALVGQALSPSYQITVVNGQMSQVVTANAVFQVRASQRGSFVIGPPTVVVNGARLVGDRVTLKVVAKGALPQRPTNPFDPFNMFGQGNDPLQQLQQQMQQMQQNQLPNDLLQPNVPIDPRFDLPRPRAAGTFLHATLDKTSAVVGEQVTLSIYIYADVSQSDPQLSDPHEAGTSDFLRRSLIKEDANIERAGFARIDGRVYAVALLRKYALFPLHAGELSITPMRLSVGRAERSSEALAVRVTEPPVAHRPPGYVVGDVGHFAITANVTPRSVQRGAAVAVDVDVSGSGNLPTSLTVPLRPGVTWLDPEVKDDMHVLDPQTAAGSGVAGTAQPFAGASDVWGGTRRFAYVVTPTKAGDVDLGEIAVSYWDPRRHEYGVARATLGVVHVAPGDAPAGSDSAKPLANMPPPRQQMGSTRGSEAHLDDSNVFWGLLAMPSALFAVAISGRRVSRRIAERARERKTSPAAELKQRLRALDAAVSEDDAREIDGATIRALESAAAAHAGVNVRGVGGEEVASVLTRAGVASETATKLRDLLEACAAARFSPDGAALGDARDRAERARAVVELLAEPAGGRPSER